MNKTKLDNDLTVIFEQRQGESVTIQFCVMVGSNDEKQGQRGISHFIEHMVFEGTKTRKDAREISDEIESLGGEINAYTDNVRTCFYIKVPKKHFEKAAIILSDILINPVFNQKDIDKERQVILKEINIFNDESRYYQWILFAKALYKKHPSRYPAYGTVEDVQKITREQILEYYHKYYSSSNSILSVVGNVKEPISIVRKYFAQLKKGDVLDKATTYEDVSSKPESKKVKRKVMNSYMVLGYRTVPRSNPDSYVLDVIQAILGKGQSGKLFDEIRNKRGLAYEVGVHHESSTDFGYFGIYLSADKSNLDLITKLIMQEMDNLQEVTDEELNSAKGFVDGKHILEKEDTHNAADELSFWEQIGDVNLAISYLDNIRKVTKNDIKNIAKKYFSQNYALALIEQDD